MPWIILAIFASYLIGSIPTAYIFGRIKGIDLRKVGSGNIGATNALRVLGKRIGIIVLLLDMFKGFAAVVFLGDFLSPSITCLSQDLLRIILALSCILGHIWTVFLNFKGGKGVATTFGVLLGLAVGIKGFLVIFVLAILSWLLTFMLTKIVSLASMVTAVTLPIYIAIFRQSKNLLFLSLILCLLVIWRHKANIQRLFQGKEPRLTFMSRRVTERK